MSEDVDSIASGIVASWRSELAKRTPPGSGSQEAADHRTFIVARDLARAMARISVLERRVEELGATR